MCGVSYGEIDVTASSTLIVDPEGRSIGVAEKGLSALESLLFAKYQMYRNVYWHHAVRSATAMYKRIVEDACDSGALSRNGSSVHRRRTHALSPRRRAVADARGLRHAGSTSESRSGLHRSFPTASATGYAPTTRAGSRGRGGDCGRARSRAERDTARLSREDADARSGHTGGAPRWLGRASHVAGNRGRDKSPDSLGPALPLGAVAAGAAATPSRRIRPA